MKGRTEAELIALSIFLLIFFFIFDAREVEYRKKNVKRTLIIYIHDSDKIFLDPKIQSDENKGLTRIVTNAS
jgi:hypothetical protein